MDVHTGQNQGQLRSTLVSIRVPETVLRVIRDRSVGMARLVFGGNMGDTVCGCDCCW